MVLAEEVVMRRILFSILMILFLVACGNSDYSSDNCAGVDTSQAPFRIQRVDYPDGHYSETWYWPNGCSHTYYY